MSFLSRLLSKLEQLKGSSVARGGLVKYAKSHVFCAFEADFLWKMENSPPHTKRALPQTFELAKLDEKSLWILAKTFFFFWRSPNFGRKKSLNFGFRPKNHSGFWRRPFFFFFFGGHLILGGKNLWISELFETFRLKFRTNRLKLIQGQWKFESRSFAHFSLFQNSPPFSKSWLRACLRVSQTKVWGQSSQSPETIGVLGVKPPTTGDFVFFKNYQFNVIQIKFCAFLEPFKRTILCMAF